MQHAPAPPKKCLRTFVVSLLLLAWRHGWCWSENATTVKPEVVLGTYVVTSAAPEYRDRIVLARRTWAPFGSPVIFVAADNDATLGIEALPCLDDEEGGVCCKTLLGLRLSLARFPNARWFVRAVDDTVVLSENLERELRVFDSSAWVYVGSPSVTLLCHIPKFAGQCAELHGGGGAGMVLSRPLAEELVLHHAEQFLEHCRHDDVFLGQYLRYVLGVHMHVLPGIRQEPRFSNSKWDLDVGTLEPCPLPLPPSVYSRIDDWGPLHPFAPLDVRRLALIHADPIVWSRLVAITQVANQITAGDSPVSGIMAYADSNGRRVVGPHFRGAETLGLCTYRPQDLLASFGAAAEGF